MGIIKRVVSWFGRKALLYSVIVAALLASAFLVPWIKTEWTGPSHYLERANHLEMTVKELEVLPIAAEERLSDLSIAAEKKTAAELILALGAARKDRANAIKRRRNSLAKSLSLATADTSALLADGKVEVEIQAFDAEIAALKQIIMKRDLRTNSGELAKAAENMRQAARIVEEAKSQCNIATEKLESFNRRWSVRLTFQLYDRAQQRKLADTKANECNDAAKKAVRLKKQEAALRAFTRNVQKAGEGLDKIRKQANADITVFTGHLKKQISAERTNAQGSWVAKMSLWAEQYEISAVLKQAAILLSLVIVVPFAIRFFCYSVLAPLAMRRGAIRLHLPTGCAASIPLSDPSSTSLGVRLAPGEELLVRQDYLQSTSQSGRKGTQWFLDWRKPLTSFATGLTFLTRIRGDGEMTTVSAVRDPFAEVAIISLPSGTSCVMHPRALAAVVQPINQQLRVTGHWQIFSLHAWLTMQLRYLVFHGPARLVIKGGRGVRVERAEQGRTFGQDQLVGFSADLSYSVTRTETFWPYFLGREQLLKDHVAAGEGILIIEEAPMAGRQTGEARSAIEGMVDASMKVFGM